ncbi:MAG: HAMP domain-containing histidine kinase [Spirochaetales bacterium]|nr:HAMP domain-containing histidine kinase [Spirochaetales bacterium]
MESVFALARDLGRVETLERPARVALEERLAAELRTRGIGDARKRAAALADSCLDPADLPPGIAGERGAAAIDLALQLSNTPRSLSIINEAAKRASRVIEAFRIYTRQSKDEDPAPIDLVESIEGILPLFAARITRDVDLTRRFEFRPLVLGQADKLAQVWTNLLSNALHAMNYKGRIEMSIRRSGESAVVSVADTGPGIPVGIRHHIFTPFFTTKPAGEGTGLGLEISRQIVLEHGGSIRFETSDSGTTFFVELPIAEERAPEAGGGTQ